MLNKALKLPVFIAAFWCAVGSAQTGVVKISDVLRSEPLPNAASVSPVVANAKLTLVERKGFWAKIRIGDATGWLKLSSITLDQGGSGASSGSTLSGLASGRTGSGNIVSASGSRSLLEIADRLINSF